MSRTWTLFLALLVALLLLASGTMVYAKKKKTGGAKKKAMAKRKKGAWRGDATAYTRACTAGVCAGGADASCAYTDGSMPAVHTTLLCTQCVQMSCMRAGANCWAVAAALPT